MITSYFTEDMNKKEQQEYYREIFFDLLHSLDFDLITNKDSNVFKLKDLQGGNLGNIEREEFLSRTSIIERLEQYIEDSIIKDIALYFPHIEYRTWEDLLCQVIREKGTEEFAECEFDIRALDLVIYGAQYID